MTAIRVGVQLHPHHNSFENYRRAWLELDEMGVDVLYDWDHFFPLYGDPNGIHWEGWTTMAAIGPLTKRAQISCMVLCMSYRNPAHLSQMAKTLDHALGGRFMLGLGAGWAERDYREYGYEFGTAGQRLKNLERGIEIIKDRWTKDEPKPVNGTIPILVGGGGEKVTLRITAQHADAWNGFGSPTEWGRKNQILTDWCNKLGRDPSQVERTCSIGSEDIDKADEYLKAGAQQIVCRLRPPHDWKEIEPLVAWRDRVRAES